jgi:hypothetical protein
MWCHIANGTPAGRWLQCLGCWSLNRHYSVMSTEGTVGKYRQRNVVIRKEYISSFIATCVYMSSFLIQSWRQLKNVEGLHLEITKYEFSWVTCNVVEVDKLWGETVGEISLQMLSRTVIVERAVHSWGWQKKDNMKKTHRVRKRIEKEWTSEEGTGKKEWRRK